MSRMIGGGVLLILAVVVGCVSEGKYKSEVAAEQNEAAQVSQLTSLNQQLSAKLSADEATIQQLQNELKVTVADKILFSEGGHTLNGAGKKTLDKIAPTLATLSGQRVVVQAFTDNVPIGPSLRARYPTNMDLSSGAPMRSFATCPRAACR